MTLSRGVFGIRGMISDYLVFRRKGDPRLFAAKCVIDYWRWDLRNWMSWTGRPKRKVLG